MKRRDFLKQSLLTAAAGIGVQAFGIPFNTAYAQSSSSKRLFFVFLRGGMDSLYAFPNFGAEAQIKSLRAGLAENISNNSLYPRFSHPSLQQFRYHRDLAFLNTLGDNLVLIPHTGSLNTTRSHFEQQDYIESGLPDRLMPQGFLARASVKLGAGTKTLAFGGMVPYSLRGAQPFLLTSAKDLNPSLVASARLPGSTGLVARSNGSLNLYERMQFLSGRDADCTSDQRMCQAAQNSIDSVKMAQTRDGQVPVLSPALEQGSPFDVAGMVALSDYRPRIITIDVGGWDTHDDAISRLDGIGSSAGQLQKLNDGLQKLRARLGDAEWANSVVVVMSEFGRTIRMNGTDGADHGRGGMMMVMGGGIKAPAAPTNWRNTWGFGTGDLVGPSDDSRCFEVHEDYRRVIAHVMRRHLGLDELALSNGVDGIFPGITLKNYNLFGA